MTTPATCTAAGKTVYTATATFEGKDYTDAKEVAGEAASGHAYGAPAWKWAEDFNSATATFTCTNCNDKQIVDATIIKKETDYGPKRVAEATFLGTTYQDAAKHWLFIYYRYENFTEAFSALVEEREPYPDNESPYVKGYLPSKMSVGGIMGDADVTETVTYTSTTPTHNLTINYVYAGGDMATEPYSQAFAEGAAYEVASPAIEGFTPDPAVVAGAMGNKDVVVTVTYTESAIVGGDHVLTIKYVFADGIDRLVPYTESVAIGAAYEVGSPAVEGWTPDKAKVSGTMGTADVTETVTYYSGHAHTYGRPTWAWADDYKSATATFTCKAKDDTQTVDATVTSKTTPATCTAAGKITYSATASYATANGADVKEVEIPATGHAYDKPVWKWADDFTSATATFTCANCNDVQTVSTTAITGAPVEAGGTKYTATVAFLGATYTGEAFGVAVPRHTLTISYVNEDGAQVAEPYAGQFAEGAAYAVASSKLTRLIPDVAVVEGTMGAADVAVTVTYSDDTCVITYRYDNNTATRIVWRGEATTLMPNPFKVPTGYSFMGWNTAADGSGTAYADGDQIVPQGDMTLYAQMGKLFVLKFDSNKGKGKMASLKVVGGETIALPKCAFKPGSNGIVFAGWAMTKDGGGATYPDGGQFTMPMEKTTLYAQWQGQPAEIKFISNGGKGKMAKMEVHVGDTVALPANTFTHESGYGFGCWTTNKDGSGERYADEAEIVVKGNTNLFAQWKGMEATVKFTGADKKAAITVTTPGTVTLPECLKTASGKVFTGWVDGSKAVHAPGEEITVWNDMLFRAQWTKAGGVKFHANKGDGKMNPLYGLPGTKARLTPNAFTRDGYEFAGWNTKSDGSGTVYKDGDSYRFVDTKTVTLYAQWRRANVKMTLKKLGKISKSDKKQILKLEATLTIDGKPVAGEYVLFSFGENTKRGKTSKDGVASIRLTKWLKDLKVGDVVVYTVTYGDITITGKTKVVE